jgi:hypothetical protein
MYLCVLIMYVVHEVELVLIFSVEFGYVLSYCINIYFAGGGGG